MTLVKGNRKSKIAVLTMTIILTFLLSGIIPSFAMQDDQSEGQTGERIIQAPEEEQNLFAFRSSKIIGSAVQNPQGEQLGTIEELIIDTESGETLFAVLSCCGFLGFGTDLFAVPWKSLIPKPALGIFILDVELEKLQEAPTFSPEDWPAIGDREWGAGIYQYYGYPLRTYPGGRYSYSTYSQRQVGGWGMATPYGREFNPETVETFEAEVIRIDRFVPMEAMTEGIELIVNLEGNPTPVHLGPSWYLDYQDFDIQEGDQIEVTGSRLELGGIPIVIATEIKSDESSLNLRDEMGFPAWSAVPPPVETSIIEDQNMITITQFLFVPGAIEVTQGTTITWFNQDVTPHTVTSGIRDEENVGEIFDSPELQPGQEFSYTFNETGEYPYFCRYHPNMTGRISVIE